MSLLPVVSIQKDFTTTGTWDPFASEGVLVPLVRPVSRWEMSVLGLDNAGAVQAPTSWDVLLLASLTGLSFPDTSLILEHGSAATPAAANGDVIWPTVSSVSPFRDAAYIRIKIKALVLGASATKIRVNVRGF
jgi:hypothetical protein